MTVYQRFCQIADRILTLLSLVFLVIAFVRWEYDPAIIAGLCWIASTQLEPYYNPNWPNPS